MPWNRFVVGYHGCDQSILEDILLGKSEIKRSANDYDWLGNGVYFWEDIFSHQRRKPRPLHLLPPEATLPTFLGRRLRRILFFPPPLVLMKPFSVLHWAPQSGTETGTGKAIEAWTAAAASAGATVYVVSQNRTPKAVPSGGVSYLGGKLGRRELLGIFRRQLREVDVVHLHGAFDPTLSIIFFLVGMEKLRRTIRGRRLIAVLTPHGALSDYVFQKNRRQKALYWHLLDKGLMGFSDGFICNTPIESDQLKRRLPRAVCSTVPLIVEQSVAMEATGPAGSPKTEATPVLCTIGRYDIGIKGLDLLIRAIVRLNHAGQPVRLRCVGYDRQGGISELQQFVDSENAGAFVECVGPKFGAEKETLLMDSTVFCMPSRYESFSYSLMEGLQSGLPVLVGSGACVTSYLNPEQKELLVVGPTVEAWVSAIRRVLASPEPTRECAGRTFRLFREMCTPTAVGESLCQIYSRLIGPEPPSSPR
jgi:glycosyltransferase involved in cell wall biosynthesis